MQGRRKPAGPDERITNKGGKPRRPKAAQASDSGVETAASILDGILSGLAKDQALTNIRSIERRPRQEWGAALKMADEVLRAWARLHWQHQALGRPVSGSSLLEALTRAKTDPNWSSQFGQAPAWVRSECPEDWASLLEAQLGVDFAANLGLMEAAPPLHLRINTLKPHPETVATRLKKGGFAATHGRWLETALHVPAATDIALSQLLADGTIEVQDEGSQIVARLVDARPGMQVLDLCAGAGGKTLALAAYMENKGHLVACDTSKVRLERARIRLKRAGVENAERVLLDDKPGAALPRRLRPFDRILIDAPCTGTGAWRRNPEQKWRLHLDALPRLQAIQDRLLDLAIPHLKPDGRLVYATCSVLEEENMERISACLERHSGLELLAAADVWANLDLGSWPFGPARNTLHLSPGRHDTDGFFAAILVKRPQPAG